jgi:hypothetical protein
MLFFSAGWATPIAKRKGYHLVLPSQYRCMFSQDSKRASFPSLAEFQAYAISVSAVCLDEDFKFDAFSAGTMRHQDIAPTLSISTSKTQRLFVTITQ